MEPRQGAHAYAGKTFHTYQPTASANGRRIGRWHIVAM